MLPSPDRPAAVLVSVQLPGVDDVQHAADLAELGRLVHTLGYDVVATITQRRPALEAAAIVGEGKLKELAKITGGTGSVPSGARAHKTRARESKTWVRRDAETEAAEEGDDARE